MEDKKEIIKNGIEDALEKIAEARDILEDADLQTGYDMGRWIKQLSENYLNTTPKELIELLDNLDEELETYDFA